MSTYTPEQREVIAGAVLDDDHTVSQALEVASLGGFGIPAFTMNPSVAYKIVAAERERRRRPSADAEDVARYVIEFCRRSVAQLEEAPLPLSVDDARRTVEVATLLREAHELLEDVAQYREYEPAA